MKKTIAILSLSLGLIIAKSNSLTDIKTLHSVEIAAEKLDIKIKNDTNDDVKVIDAASGGSYSLTKGATTTIKMEEGDKLHYYEKGKKGDLILVATKSMHGKVQLLSKIN